MARTEDRRARTRPAELVGLAGVIAVFVGLVVLVSTRDWAHPGGPTVTLVFTGAAFIVSLVLFAMLSLVERSSTRETRERAEAEAAAARADQPSERRDDDSAPPAT